MKRKSTPLLSGCLALAILCGACTAAFASTVYSFSGTLDNGGSVTGAFTYDPTSGTISSFAFNLPTLPIPVSTITSSNGYVSGISPTAFQFGELGSYDEFLTLVFGSVSGTLIAAESGLTQYPSGYGSTADYGQNFSVGSADPETTPLPSSWTMLLAALFGFGILLSRQRGNALTSFEPKRT